jgi:hypothetical protein
VIDGKIPDHEDHLCRNLLATSITSDYRKDENRVACLGEDVDICHVSDRPRAALFVQDHTSKMESQRDTVTVATANAIALRSGRRLLVRCLRSTCS